MTANWARCIAVLLVVSTAGCATAPPASAPYRLPSGANVALAAGRFDPTVHPEPPGNKTTRRYKTGSSLGDGLALAGASVLYCVQALYLYPVCVASISAVSITAGVVGEIIEEIEESPSGKEKTPEELAAERKALEERLAAEGKALEERIAAERDANKRILPEIAAKADALRPLLMRVQSLARETGVGDFEVLTNSDPQSEQDQRAYDKKADYVFEFAVAGIVFKRLPARGYFYVDLHTQGRLVRANDNVVVDTFIARAPTRVRHIDEWTAGDLKDLSAALNPALDKLANEYVYNWISPVVEGRRYVRNPSPESNGGKVKAPDERRTEQGSDLTKQQSPAESPFPTPGGKDDAHNY